MTDNMNRIAEILAPHANRIVQLDEMMQAQPEGSRERFELKNELLKALNDYTDLSTKLYANIDNID